ncbi:universal stress protein [Salinibacterium sp. ZJ450]|uniref:universal stress protein n=1 Tax=Salinibacterium sp. ZJ450 TaxID=2708338 RepID=UPI001422033B|nr:universal stress protein [Salinibacterium sp. ZJ450]
MQQVIVAVDGSPASLGALDWAIERSRHVEMSIDLVAVLWIPDAAFQTETELRPFYEKTLQDAQEHVRRTAPRVKTSARLLRGVPVNELVDYSATAALLVVGSDKSSRLRALVYGTIPLRLAALSRCPVVVVPRVWKQHPGPVMLAVGEEPATEAADFAVAEATARGVVLDLIHVWAASPIYPVPVADLHYPYTTVRDAHRDVLDTESERIHAAHPNLPVTHQLKEGPQIHVLVDAGEHAQLLVIGRTGKGILRELLLGSVAHDVLLNPPCPVAVIPTHAALKKAAAARAAAEGS